MRWSDRIVGQQEIIDSFTSSVTNNQLSHAVIIEGVSGYGGLPISLALAELILCVNDDRPCGDCKACRQVQSLIHPDLHIAFPVLAKEGMVRKNVTSKEFLTEWRELILDKPYTSYNDWIRSIAKSTANGDINVKECNDIIQQLNMQAYSGDRKVQIIWIADRLGSNGNKLLKLIEEPPAGTFIILIVDQLEFLLQTIISRCRVIRLPGIHADAISDRLISAHGVEQDQAQQIGHISDGDFSQALAYIHMDQSNLMDLCIRWLSYCRDGDVHTLRQWSTEFSRYNLEEQKAILHFFLKVMRSVIYARILGSDAIKLSAKDKERLLSDPTMKTLDESIIENISSIISEMMYMLERYVSGRMVALDASLRIHQAMRSKVMA